MFSNFKINAIKNLELEYPNQFGYTVAIKPEYLIHPDISGNKYRKLKYNLQEAKNQNLSKILTFGGAYSNHIAAVAAAGIEYGFSTVGIIRGEELASLIQINPTLKFALKCGMVLKFISRELYQTKTSDVFVRNLEQEFGDFYMLPEGGTNQLAVKGCEEILTKEDLVFDYIGCSIGTGGTMSGLINSSLSHQKILGFQSLKGDFLQEEIPKFATKNNWKIINAYHFGGYAKINSELISFINEFKMKYEVPLDPVYTGKMFYGIFDMMEKGYFPENSKILGIHTGGLQGISGMNLKLKQKKLPIIV